MTAATLEAGTSHPRSTPSARLDRATRLWMLTGCFMLAGALVVLPAGATDSRTLDGIGLWAKPFKFWVSVAIHFLTLGVLVRLLAPTRRLSSLVLGVAYVSVAAGIFEVLYITLQAARGRASHFNVSTSLEIALYALMGVGAVLLLVASFTLGIALLAQRRTLPSNGLHTGAVLGLITGSVLTLLVAGVMSSGESHFFGMRASDANGLPLVGWSTRFPDLRPAHFAATHLMQALPLIGLACDRVAPRLARAAVWVATVAGIALVALLFGIALGGASPLGFLA